MPNQSRNLTAGAAVDCMRILELDPNHSEALHRLGALASEAGNQNVAASLIAQAIRSAGAPRPGYCADLGVVLHRQGNLEASLACYRQAAALDPGNAEVCYRMGNVLESMRKFDEAAASYGRAVRLDPSHAEARYNLAVALMQGGQPAAAEDSFREALRLTPGRADAHNNLGILLHARGIFGEARRHYRCALQYNRRHPDAAYNLASALYDSHDLEGALDAYRAVVKEFPHHMKARNNLASTLAALGRPEEAAAVYRALVAADPDNREAWLNLGLVELLLGRFEEGWQNYEWRLRCSPHVFTGPVWDGAPSAGRGILLHAEQGLGDTIQFIRYAPMVKTAGGCVTVVCQASLTALLRTVPGAGQVIAKGDPAPDCECHAPLLSLPRIFHTSLDTIPRDVPYVYADARSVEEWRTLLPAVSGSRKVGIVWAGSPTHANDRNRSIPFETLSVLGEIPGVSFFSLQQGAGPAQAGAFRPLPLARELRDFADTAAVVANLDLVISVDTAVAHLAGALGKPVWTLLPFAPDWRWMLKREDSPWYPTMRLFRQPKPRDWVAVLKRVKDELRRR